MSLPSRERGLKFSDMGVETDTLASLPSRERGLKSENVVQRIDDMESLPSRERGLKYFKPFLQILRYN